MKRVGVLIGAALAFWVVAAVPARHLWGNDALLFSGTALALCLVPAVLTLFLADWVFPTAPDQQLMLILGATGVRLFVVGGVAFLLYEYVPYYQSQQAFLIWLLVYYLFILTVEKVLILKGRRSSARPE